MVHLTHSALHWKLRCIMDSPTSEDENTPPNIARANSSKTNPSSEKSSSDKSSDDTSSTGTATPSWMPPGFSKLGYSKAESNPASQSSTETEASPLRHPRTVASPTTSSPVLLEDATPRPSPLTTTRTKAVERRQARREEADPYSRDRTVGRQEDRPVTNPSGSIRPASVESIGPRLGSSRTSDVFVPARWPHQVAHLREPIRRGQEVTADYGDDLWFVCRCGSAGCRHRDIQGFCDP
ncbi:hypothetical protein F441_10844 [Phytophthora nicotianae CJ01A1]|uniref:SET domain-containing protein n=1 Tax=Phytophthora nicotianae CJ01A1 TaxID=1317063 RepID=W2WX99_PHYNI|nr:hypothetical protein F441_10844 [Phytophthora nicotianae CJ01A1]